jgi:hypothetical protein
MAKKVAKVDEAAAGTVGNDVETVAMIVMAKDRKRWVQKTPVLFMATTNGNCADKILVVNDMIQGPLKEVAAEIIEAAADASKIILSVQDEVETNQIKIVKQAKVAGMTQTSSHSKALGTTTIMADLLLNNIILI